MSYEEESGEEGHGNIRRQKSKRVFYNPTCTVPTFLVGMVFKSAEEFRTAIAKYAIARGVERKFEKNETHRVRCRCKQACPWSVFASSDKKSGDFVVKSYHPNHRCTRVWKNRRASCDHLVSYFNDVIEDHPKLTCLQMVEYAKNTYNWKLVR